MAEQAAPGRLIYVMGASGAGKDTVLEGCRRRLDSDEGILVAQRFVTRDTTAEQDGQAFLDRETFRRRQQAGDFSLVWSAHGQHYGISRTLDRALTSGLWILVNGSRAYLPEAQRAYPDLIPVLIEAEPQRVAARLRRRGREGEQDIARRLERNARLSQQLPAGVYRIENDGPPERAIEALLELVRRLQAQAIPGR